jgi:uncharacterized protein (TIGR00297 family)
MPASFAFSDLQIILIMGIFVALAAVLLGKVNGKEPPQQLRFRKYLHILACGACTVSAALLSQQQLLIPAVLIAEMVLLYLVIKRDFFTINGEKSYGIVLFPLAFLVLLLLFPHPKDKVFIVGPMGFLALCDAMAALVGMRFASRHFILTGDKKSWQGAVAFWVTGIAWMLLLRFWGFQTDTVTWVFLAGAAGISGIAACAELMGSKGRDNLWIPLITVWLLYVWSQQASVTFVSTMWLSFLLIPAGILACYRKWLSASGTVAALFLGMTILISGFSLWPMLLFFLTGSVLSKLPGGKSSDAKSGKARDHIQVFSNGGVALILAIANSVKPLPVWEYLYIISAAVACSDTWSSEIGQRFSKTAFDLRRFRLVPAGLSGCISVQGTLAAIAGAACIAVFANSREQMFAVLLWGFAGSLLDSLLGAFLQARYGQEIQHDMGVGKPTQGFAAISNDVVNALSSAGIAGIAAMGLLLNQ